MRAISALCPAIVSAATRRLFFGVLSILFSFGKGLVFFAPGILVPITRDELGGAREHREMWAYSLWFLAGLIVVYSKWWSWYGGWVWGPRFFLIASVPAAISGAVFDTSNLHTCTDNSWALEFLCWYTPEFSVLWHPFIEHSPVSFDQGLFVGYCTIVWIWLTAPLFKELGGRLVGVFEVAARQKLKGWRF